MNLKNLLKFTFLLAFVTLLSGNAFAQTTYYVDGTGGGNDAWSGTAAAFVSGNIGPKATIQAMLNDPAVVNGDLIEIVAGIYPESVTLTKRVELYVNGAAGVTVNDLTLNTGSTTDTKIAETNYGAGENITVNNTLAILSGDYDITAGHIILADGGILNIGFSNTYTGLDAQVDVNAGLTTWNFTYAGNVAYAANDLGDANPMDVNVTTAGALTLPANMTVVNDLTVGAGSTLDLETNNIDIAVGNDFTNNGAIVGAAGDQIQMAGGVISGAGTFMDLVINGATDLGSNLTFLNISQVTASLITLNAALDLDGFNLETPGSVTLAGDFILDGSAANTGRFIMSGTAGTIGNVNLTVPGASATNIERFTINKPAGSIVNFVDGGGGASTLTVTNQFIFTGGNFNCNDNNVTLGANHTTTCTIGGNINGTGIFTVGVTTGNVVTDGAGAINTQLVVNDGGNARTYTFTQLITIGNNLTLTNGEMITSSLQLINGAVAVNGGTLTLNTTNVSVTSNFTMADGTTFDGTSNVTINGNFADDGTGAGTVIDKDAGTVTVAGTFILTGNTSFKADGLTVQGGACTFAGGAIDINGNLAVTLATGDATFGAGDADIDGTCTVGNDMITGAGDVNVDGALTVGNDLFSNAGLYTYKGTAQNTVGNDIIASAVNAGAPALRFYGPVDVGNDARCAGATFGQSWRFDGVTNFTRDLDFDNLTVGNTPMTVNFYGNMSARDLLLNDDLAHVINFNDASTPIGQLRNITFSDLAGANAAATINVNAASATSYYYLYVSGDITVPAGVTSIVVAVDANARVILNGTGDLDTYANAQNINLAGQALAILNLEVANAGTDSDVTALTGDGGGAAEVDERKESVYVTGNILTVTKLWLTSNGISGTNLTIANGGTITRSGGAIEIANQTLAGTVSLVYTNQTDITTGREYTVAQAGGVTDNLSLTGTGGKVTLTATMAQLNGKLTVDANRELAMTNGLNNYNFVVDSDGDAAGDKMLINGTVSGAGKLIMDINNVTAYDIEGTGSVSNFEADFAGAAGTVNMNGPATLTGDFTSVGGAGTVVWGTGAPATIGDDAVFNIGTGTFRKSVTVTDDVTQTAGNLSFVNVAGDTWYDFTVGGDYTQATGNLIVHNLSIGATLTLTNGAFTFNGNGSGTVNGNATFAAGTAVVVFPTTSIGSLHLKGATNTFTGGPTFTFAGTASGRIVFDGAVAQALSITGGNLIMPRVGINNAAGVSVTSIANNWQVANLLLSLGTLTHNGLLSMAGGTDRIIRDAGVLATFAAVGPAEVEFIGAADTQAGFELPNVLTQLIANGTGTYTLDKNVTVLTGGTVNLSKGILAAGGNLTTQTLCTIIRAEGAITGNPVWGTNQTLQYMNTVNDLVAGPEWTNDGKIVAYLQNSPGKKVSLANDVTLAGNGQVLFGTLDVVDYTLTVAGGNWDVDGAMTTGVAGKLKLTGAAAQLQGKATAWPNLEIAKTTANAVTFTPDVATADWTFDSFTGTDGAFAITAMDDITILGDFTVGALFDNFNMAGGDDWFFQGDFTWAHAVLTSGALNQPVGSVFNFTGTEAQTINTNKPNVEFVTINNAAGVDLAQNLALDDNNGKATLTLTAGQLRTGAFAVQMGLVAAAIPNPIARVAGYIVGNVHFYLDSNPAAAINHVFPMGTDDGNYRPLTMGFATRAALTAAQFGVIRVQHVDEAPVGEVGIVDGGITNGGVTVNKLTPAYWLAGFYNAANAVLLTPFQNPTVTLVAGGFTFGDITKIRALYRLTNVLNTWLIPGTFIGSFYSIAGDPTVVHAGVQGWTLEPQQLFAVGYESTFANTVIADQNVETNGTPVVIDLADYVSGSIGAVTYGAVSDDVAVATAVLAGSELTITGVADGTANVTVTYTDTNGDELTDTFVVTVTTLTNLPPVFVDVLTDQEIPVPFTFTYTATDPDGDALTFEIVAPIPSGAEITDGGVLTWTATSNGTYVITVQVSDGQGNVVTTTATVTVTAVGVEDELDVPTDFSLSQNYPNPFNPTTTIRFSLPEATNVVLKVYNILGQEVASLLDQNMSAGYHEVQFDASNMTTGMYIYKLQAGEFVSIKKMMLAK